MDNKKDFEKLTIVDVIAFAILAFFYALAYLTGFLKIN